MATPCEFESRSRYHKKIKGLRIVRKPFFRIFRIPLHIISLRSYWQQFARVSGSAAGPGGQGPGRWAIHRGRFWSLPVCAAAFGDKGSRRRRLASRAAGCPALGEIVYLPYPLANFLFQCYGFIKHFLWSALFQERFTEKTCRTPQPPGMLGFRHIPVSS